MSKPQLAAGLQLPASGSGPGQVLLRGLPREEPQHPDPQIVPHPNGQGYMLVREDGVVIAAGNILDCRRALAEYLAEHERARKRRRDEALRRAILT